MASRAPYRRRFPAKNRKPTYQHEREPNAPLPLPGCSCDACEHARIEADDRIGRVMGMEPELELNADAAGKALQDAFEQVMRRRG